MRLLKGVWGAFGCVVLVAGCGFPQPARVGDDGLSSDGGPGSDAQPAANPICEPNQALRCSPGALVRCNADGTAEVSESCLMGCSTAELRCKDVTPSNGLAPQLDMTTDVPDLDLGMNATIDTDSGTVVVDGNPIVVRHAVVEQSPAPSIGVFIVRSLTARDVIVTGKSALAFVSHGDLTILGKLTLSGHNDVPGPGAFNEPSCVGGDTLIVGTQAIGGPGGGGFGRAGGEGGDATTVDGTSQGGAGGNPTGSPGLVPLRGGCSGGRIGGKGFGGVAGGAVQLVSRTRITISGVVAANGVSGIGGGSGGGILLESPIVEVTGNVVANGGAGSGGCLLPMPGENGRLDALPAAHGVGCQGDVNGGGADGGDGGARDVNALRGRDFDSSGTGGFIAYGGHGGGGVGRIRVNTVPGGLHATGIFSPTPTTGELGSR
ncbi:MAG TPA: hypothetical protein VFT22_41265 [Kofleriaceae bacterium]|nr:hypothetical protein [Kofleriaceae bacterium]